MWKKREKHVIKLKSTPVAEFLPTFPILAVGMLFQSRLEFPPFLNVKMSSETHNTVNIFNWKPKLRLHCYRYPTNVHTNLVKYSIVSASPLDKIFVPFQRMPKINISKRSKLWQLTILFVQIFIRQ